MEILPPDGTKISETMTVEGGGSTCPDASTPSGWSGGCATYSTLSTDLPMPGDYVFQWVLSSGSSILWMSDEQTIYVGASL